MYMSNIVVFIKNSVRAVANALSVQLSVVLSCVKHPWSAHLTSIFSVQKATHELTDSEGHIMVEPANVGSGG